VPLLPDIHPLVDKLYQPTTLARSASSMCTFLPNSLGATGREQPDPGLERRPLLGRQLRSATTPASEAAQNHSPALSGGVEKSGLRSGFRAKLYADSLGRKYSGLRRMKLRGRPPPLTAGLPTHISGTGLLDQRRPRCHYTRGKLVFISESFRSTSPAPYQFDPGRPGNRRDEDGRFNRARVFLR